MGSEIHFLVEESPEGGYEAKAVGYSIYTEAESIDALKAAIIDAVRCHFEETNKPSLIRLHIEKEEVLAV
ncbi:TPA: 2-oxoisovalerate dehydrogenase [archaeon]|nr:2-oxoisovalerate dehydrogenase [Candidatus Naiadarchaeales archaeon SRR2090153.bin461]